MTPCLSGAALWGRSRRSITTETDERMGQEYFSSSSWQFESLKRQCWNKQPSFKRDDNASKWWRDTRNYLWWIQALFLFVIAFQHNGCSINGKWLHCSKIECNFKHVLLNFWHGKRKQLSLKQNWPLDLRYLRIYKSSVTVKREFICSIEVVSGSIYWPYPNLSAIMSGWPHYVHTQQVSSGGGSRESLTAAWDKLLVSE